MDEQMMTSVDVYDSTRLPHYGAIDYPEGSETVAMGEEALAEYVAACERYAATADEDGYLDPDQRDGYQVTVRATMTAVATGETYERDDLALLPGDLRWSGMPAACRQVER